MASHRSTSFRAPAECPVCGASVKPGARACPECGADERSGWNDEETRYDGLDLPNEVFESEDAPIAPPRRNVRQFNGISVGWWLVGVGLSVVFLWQIFGVLF